MNEENTPSTWLNRVEARGMGGLVRLLLDIATPFSIIGGQLLWIVQPVATLFGKGSAVGDLARWLEQPNALQDLRAQLDASHFEERPSDDQTEGKAL